MKQLNVQQLKERKIILSHFFESFKKDHPWFVTKEQAEANFILYLQNNLILLRTINGLAASERPI